jgi:cation transport ATPase
MFRDKFWLSFALTIPTVFWSTDVLVRSDPRDVVGAIKLSRAAYGKMIQNLVWATAYNLAAIPIAGGLFVR